MAKKRTLPRYMQRYERPWFRKGKALIKELTKRKLPEFLATASLLLFAIQ